MSKKGYIYALLAVFFWSFNVIVGSYLVNTLRPWQISFFRWFIASLVLLPFTIKSIKRHKNIFIKKWKYILFLSFIGITLSNTCVYFASYSISAIEMSLISVTGPIFLILFAHFLGGDPVLKNQKIGIIFAILGVFLIFLQKRTSSTSVLIDFRSGDLWMLLMALTFGFYSFLVSKKPKSMPEIPMLSISIILGCCMCVPPFIYEHFMYPIDWNLKIILIMIYMGVFNSVLAYYFWNKALIDIGSLKSSVIYYMMPIFSSVEAYLFFGSTITLLEVIGGIFILVGVALTNRNTENKWHIERA